MRKRIVKVDNLWRGVRPLDLAVLFILVAVMMGAYLWFHRSKEKVLITMFASPVAYINSGPVPQGYWIADSINIGDVGRNSLGQEVAKVVEMESIDSGGDRKKLWLVLEVVALKNKKSRLYQFDNQQLRIGGQMELTVGDVKLVGTVVNIDGINEPQSSAGFGGEDKIMTVRLKSLQVHPNLAKEYTEKFVMKDQQGRVIFRIIQAGFGPAITEEVTADGKVVVAKHPILVDVDMVAEIMVSCHAEICYFSRDNPIKLNGSISAQTNRVVLSNAIITEIINEKPVE